MGRLRDRVWSGTVFGAGRSQFLVIENERFAGIFVTHQPRVQPEKTHSLGLIWASSITVLRKRCCK